MVWGGGDCDAINTMECENGEALDPTTQEEVATLALSTACPSSHHAIGSGTIPSPTTSDCNGGGTQTPSCNKNNNNGNNKKRSRSAPWTAKEMLTLIDAKKEEGERCQLYKMQGVKLSATEKWRIVANHMEGKDMGRSGSQCQDKWENMMKDYKAVREWQYILNPTGKNYFKEMTNKERKDASLPPQMDEVVFYSLHAIQNEKEEKKDKARVCKIEQQQRENCKQPNTIIGISSSLPSLIANNKCSLQAKDKVGSSEANDMESMDTDSTGKGGRKRKRKLGGPTRLPMSLENPVVLDDFFHVMKDGSNEFVDYLMKVLERSSSSERGGVGAGTRTGGNGGPAIPGVQPQQMSGGVAGGHPEHHIRSKDTAALAHALVALVDAVKTIVGKL